MLGGRQDKNGVLGRFFESFKKGVKRVVRDLVRFVDDIHFVTAARRGITNVVAELSNFFDAAIRSRIDFQHIDHFLALRDARAAVALVAGRVGRAFLAVESFGKNARRCGFSHTSRAGEQISVCHFLRGQRIFKRLGDMGLADDVVERLRAVFAGENAVAHAIGPFRRSMRP